MKETWKKKNRIICFLVICSLLWGGCGQQNVDSDSDVSLTSKPTIIHTTGVEPLTSPTEQGTATPAITLEPTKEQTEEPTKEPTAIPTPTAEPTKAPTAEPTKEPTAEPTKAPTATPTLTPIPTAAPTLTATPIPTKAPTPTASSDGVEKLMERAVRIENTILNATRYESEAEASEYVRLATQQYSEFGLLVSEQDFFHTEAEYMAMYPEITSMRIDRIELYNNGICIRFAGVTAEYDANLLYAIRTGKTEVLTDTETKIYQALRQIVSALDIENVSDIEKIKAVHDYLVLNTEYTTGRITDISHTPEGLLFNKSAVCDGYARTFRLLLELSGIESTIISGTAGGDSHAWNLVCLEGNWYHIDVTWDDPVPDEKGRVFYNYFMKTDEYMADTHHWSSEISCTDTTYEIYAYQAYVCNTEEAAAALCEAQLQENKKLIQFCYLQNGELTESILLDIVKQAVQSGISYYGEREVGNYMLLQVINPFVEE